ncbi:hypothetical protein MASR2M78_18140 [Treponema sp.]
MKKIIILTIAILSLLFSSCEMFHQPKLGGGIKTNAASNGTINIGTGKTGNLAVTVPVVSSYLAQMFVDRGFSLPAAGSAAGSRALLLASRVDFELFDSADQRVDSWSTGPLQAEIVGGSPTQLRPVTEGTAYTLHAKVFNNQVSTTVPVVEGEVSGIDVTAGQSTEILIPCFPNESLAGTFVVGGSQVSGSLIPIKISGNSVSSWDGGEKWYSFGGTNGWVRITPGVVALRDILGIAVYDSDGHPLTNNLGYGTGGILEFPTSGDTTYYLGVITATRDPAKTSMSYSFNTEEFTPVSGILNGDFSGGTSNWRMNNWNACNANLSVVNGEAVITNINVAFSCSLSQSGFVLAKNQSYRLSYKARVSSGSGHISAALTGTESDSLWLSMGSIDTTMAEKSFIFSWDKDPCLLELEIYMSENVGKTVYFDDVSILPCINPLEAPTNFNATVNGKIVTLNWEPVSGADDYQVLRDGYEIRPDIIGQSTNRVDYETESNKTYTYTVMARKMNEALSPPSSQRTVTTGEGGMLSGTLTASGLGDGTYRVSFIDGHWQSYSKDLAFFNGTANFNIPEGMPNIDPIHLVAWFDSNGDRRLSVGEKAARVDSGYTYSAATGAANSLNFFAWQTATAVPLLAKAFRMGDDLWIYYMETRTNGSILRNLQRSEDLIAWTDAAGSTGGNMNSYWKKDEYLVGSPGTTYYWRVGVDVNGNGMVEENEYGEPTQGLIW